MSFKPLDKRRLVLGRNSLSDSLFSSAFVALIFRVTGVALVAFLNLMIAWKAGAEFAGYFFSALAILMIASVASRLGLDLVILRRISQAARKDDVVAAREYLRKASLFVAATGTLTASLLILLTHRQAIWPTSEAYLLFGFIISSLPFLSVASLVSEAFKGLGAAHSSVLVLSVIPPGVTLMVLEFAVQFAGPKGIGMAYFAATTFGSVAAYGLLRFRTRNKCKAQENPSLRKCLREARPLWLLMTINRGLLPWLVFPLLAIFATSEEVGQFGMATRVAMLVGLPLVCIEAVLAPRFAHLHQMRDLRQMCSLGKRCSLFGLLATSPGLLILLAPEPVMSIFGAEFIGAAPVLMILVLGQFANAAFGSVGLCLTMTGYGRQAAIASFFSLSVLALCAMFFMPAYGAIGAAIATAAGLISNRLVGAIFLYRSFGFALFPSWVRA